MFVFIYEVIWYIRETFASVHYVHVFLGKNYFVKLQKWAQSVISVTSHIKSITILNKIIPEIN